MTPDLLARAADPGTPLTGGYPSIRWFLDQARGMGRFVDKARGRDHLIALCAALASNPALPLGTLAEVLRICPPRAERPRYPSYDYLPKPVVEALRGNLALCLHLLSDPALAALPPTPHRRIAVSRVWPSIKEREAAA